MEIKSNNAKELWIKAIKTIKEQGQEFKDNDERTCIELYNLTLKLENAQESKTEEPIQLMINSKKWIYPSKDELESVMFKESQAPIYEYTYGGRIFNLGQNTEKGLDQINQFILPLLNKDPNTRRAIIVLYEPHQDSDITNKNSPGIIYIHFIIRNQQLNITCHIRSNDLFYGWPANMYQIYCLHKYVAEKLKIKQGNISTISNSAHIFKEDLENINEVLETR